jgi:hypothetical protein
VFVPYVPTSLGDQADIDLLGGDPREAAVNLRRVC